ncbi:MAG: hypothetical protein EXR79_11605 [Myxococcales bacterium]|nr:hypothetical protein [Myxococcales bacterium]
MNRSPCFLVHGRDAALRVRAVAVVLALGILASCVENPPKGLARSQAAEVTVKFDFLHRPLPDIPLPNDLATRHDPTSATLRRINASMVAPTQFERRTRELVDTLDGWGTFSPISVPFTGPIDVLDLAKRHHGDDYAFANDAVYVIDVTPNSPGFGKPRELDLGNGNFPVVLEKLDHYWRADPRGDTNSVLFEEIDEDTNANGKLDPGEDTDLDGRLDKPNWLPGTTKARKDMDLAERADALMTFWERETNTLLARPLQPLRERTTYAVVVTRRLKDTKGKPVGSPYPWVHHLAQTDALRPLQDVLAANAATYGGLKLTDIAFAHTFTTGSMLADIVAVRDGMNGSGAQKALQAAFPPEVSNVAELHDAKPAKPYESKYSVSGETFDVIVKLLAQTGIAGGGGVEATKRLGRALKYVSHHAVASYDSPQFFDRVGKDGRWLGLNDQSWPPDLDKVAVPARKEKVTFWMTVPRKEATANGKPAGIVVLGHGYTGSKTEIFGLHAWFSMMGMVVVAIDNVSHGFDLSPKEQDQISQVFEGFGIMKLLGALMTNRSVDQNLDGQGDSGADFWTAYTFHTRDVVRQSAVDYMQLIRVLRGFDGKRTWKWDANGNGKADDLAGDFDGDGSVDVGGPETPIHMTGGSLGGIMAAVVGGIEPQLLTTAPIAGGGGLVDVGVRSIQGGVKEAVTLRLMCPIYVSAPDKSGALDLATIVPDLNDDREIKVARLPADVVSKLAPGDSVRLDNLGNGEYDCARIFADTACQNACDADAKVIGKTACRAACLTLRLSVASDIDFDAPQAHRFSFFKGDPFVPGLRDEEKGKACTLKADAAKPVYVAERFDYDVSLAHRIRAVSFKRGQTLSPLAEGLGLKRATPGIRRFMGFAQMVLDRADPAVYAQHFLTGDVKYANGEKVQTHALVLNTVGDMNVPVSTGAAIGRAAGLLDFKTKIPEWGGRTVNQTLIDTYVLEAVDKIPRFVAPDGTPVLFDPEDLSGSATPTMLPPAGQKVTFAGPLARGKDGFHVPRLSPPLHTKAMAKDAAGGVSGTFFPFIEPAGKHGFWNPGEHWDSQRKQCEQDAEAAGKDGAGCKDGPWFDHGSTVVSSLGAWMHSGGKAFRIVDCLVDGCPEVLGQPKGR